jgi:hypothetical protein
VEPAITQVSEQMEAPTGASFDDAGVADNVVGLWRDLRGMAHDHLQLAALEAQRAGRSLVAMLAASIVLGVLLASTLLILTGALILALIELGLPPSFSALLAALVNLTASVALAFAIRARSRLLGFPATLRNLQPAAKSTTPDGAAS